MKKVIYLVWQGQHEDKVLKIATEDKEIAWRWAAHHKRTGVQYAQPDTTVTEIELTNYAAYDEGDDVLVRDFDGEEHEAVLVMTVGLLAAVGISKEQTRDLRDAINLWLGS